ncbi:MAG: hypothetical protein ABGW49_01585, partial [Nitrosopumilus sp.]
MAGIDKAAIVFSIAIALVGVAIAGIGDSVDYTPTTKTTPSVSTQVSEPKSSESFGADLASKIRAEAENMDESVSLQDRQVVDDKAAAQVAADKAAAQVAADKAAAQVAADKAAAQVAADKAAAQVAADKAAAQ